MMTVSHPRFSALVKVGQRPTFKGYEAEAEYREGLRGLDQETLKQLYRIQHHPHGIGHEVAIEYGMSNPQIAWLNEEKRGLLQQELVNKQINPKLSAKARELFHDLNRAIDRTLREELIPDHEVQLHKRRRGPSSNSSASNRHSNFSTTG